MKKILALLILLTLVVTCFAACKKDDEQTQEPPVDDTPVVEAGPSLEDAKTVLRDLYKDKSTTTAGDFDVVASVMVDGVKFNVTWATDNANVVITESTADNAYTVDIVPAEPEADIPYILTATITDAEGNTTTVVYNYTVPKFKVNTYAEYLAAEKEAPLVVEGVIYGINTTEKSIFVQDVVNGGGYYVYSLADLTGLAVGQTVRVKGLKDIYNGTPEVVEATVEVKDTELTPVTPTDLTDVFTAANTANAETLLAHLGEYVTIKGVTILAVDATNSTYYCFELDGVKTYLRISGSSNCTTEEQQATIIENHNKKFYYTADVTGIAAIYGGNFYIMPVDANAFSNFSAEQQPLPDDVKAGMVKDALSLPTDFVTTNGYNLPATGTGDNFSDVTIAWALADGTVNATLADGVLTPVLPTEEGTVAVTITATITKNDVVLTKDFSVNVTKIAADKYVSIANANTTAATMAHNTYTTDKYVVEGTIKSIANAKYGNVYIQDTEGNELYVYGTYDEVGAVGYANLASKPKVGDKVVVYGVLGQYNGTKQMKNAWILSWEHVTTTETVNATCKTDGYVRVVCACGDIISETTLPMGAHDYVDGVCSACGVKNHEHTTVAGTVVAPTCEADGYTVYSCSDENCTYTENKDVTTKLDHSFTDGICTREGCYGSDLTDALAAADGTSVTVQGVVTAVNTAWNSGYGNMCVTITDSNGQTLYIYRLTTRVVLGETIKVTGTMATYSGARQIASGATAEILIKHECEYTVAATCTTAILCEHCDAVQDGSEALGHSWGETAVTTAPTCTAKGYDTYTCTRCNTTKTENETNALGHEDTDSDGLCDRLVGETKCGLSVTAVEATVTAKYPGGTTTNWASTHDASTLGLDTALFTVTADKGGASNNIGLNTAGELRFYYGASGGNKLTFDMADGYTVKSIKITFTSASYGKNCQISAGGTVVTTTSADGVTTVEVEINANSFDIYNANTSNTQVRISSIEITYVG